MKPDEIIEISLREAGIQAYGLLGEAALREACGGMPASLLARLGLGSACGAIIAALPYAEGAAPLGAAAGTPPAGALAKIARFARANWYAELAARLKDAAAGISRRLCDEGRPSGSIREWRYFVNSAFPEKRLALEAGLGELGVHSLVMLPSHGSAAVLGLLIAPKSAGLDLERSSAAPGSFKRRLSPACDGCRACVSACPTGALGRDGSFARELCLQHWSSIAGSLPRRVEEAWGDRLYGCDACQEACPLFKPDEAATTHRGVLGPGLSASWLISSPEEEIRAALRKTALGMRWISIGALKRNALLALPAV